jgi:hypothetical protein
VNKINIFAIAKQIKQQFSASKFPEYRLRHLIMCINYNMGIIFQAVKGMVKLLFQESFFSFQLKKECS